MKLNRYALAASFNCAKAHSTAETLICRDVALSRADDELGNLFRLAQRQAADGRAYRRDSDSKWAWREANCTDIACLADWYATRIEEIREQLHQSAQDGERARPGDADLAAASEPAVRPAIKPARRDVHASSARDIRQCTATTQDLVPPVQCHNVLEKRTAWRSRDADADNWFCGVAMIEGRPQQGSASQ
ncbi:hypothetical protein H3V53_05670 [Paraburkholderia bengalensis]|uniref:Lysozyme inhibitor LprI N-terminal domain-containing protein n=1 Tax=Paraburkholderia bengalensis TaxID=2747562 RepID=A0ABU8IM85_9BURK